MASGIGATSGATLTQEDVRAVLIDPLRARSVVLAAAPQSSIFETDGVPLRIPRLDDVDLTDPWRAENTLIDEVDPVFGEVVLLPSSLKSLKALHRYSNELARLGVVEVASVLGDALVREIALAWDKAALTGDGAVNTVLGLSNQPGVTTQAAVGAIDVDVLHDAEGLLLAANGDPMDAAWFMNPRDLIALRKQREGAGSGQYLIHPDASEGGRYTLLGHPVYVTTQIAADGGVGTNESTIILADMAQVAIGVDVAPRAEILRETYGDFDQQALRIVARMDIAPLNPAAVIVLDGVTA